MVYPFRAGIITASDKGSRGEREDLSGPAIAELIGQQGYYVCSSKILPDEEEDLYQEMVRLADEEKVDVIFTTGGTGLSPRDNTPEATLRAATKNVPGIAEAIRAYSMQITPRAMPVSYTHLAQVSMPAADIGLPQLAMHSAYETAGAKDIAYLITLTNKFFE